MCALRLIATTRYDGLSMKRKGKLMSFRRQRYRFVMKSILYCFGGTLNQDQVSARRGIFGTGEFRY
jgi:hypothetical protein